MAKKGNEVTLLYSKPTKRTKRLDIPGVRIVYSQALLPLKFRRNGFGICDTLYGVAFVLRQRFDVIHTITGHRPSRFITMLIGKLRGAVTVDEWWEWFGGDGIASVRKGLVGSAVSKYDTLMEVRLKAFFDGIVAISSALKARLGKRPGVIVSHGAVEEEQLKIYEKKAARTSLGIDINVLVVGMANVAPDDDVDNSPFFTALRDLVALNSNILLVMTGDHEYFCKGPRKLLGACKHMHLGWPSISKYSEFLSACDVFAMPYPETRRNLGRWPNKLGDYIFFKKPVITNYTGDVGEVFEKYNLGWQCSNSEDSYKKILIEVLDSAEHLDLHVTDAGSLLMNELTFSVRADRILKLYRDLLESKRYANWPVLR
jgi:glycosyltransferase involved in cell wall biosynthesis